MATISSFARLPATSVPKSTCEQDFSAVFSPCFIVRCVVVLDVSAVSPSLAPLSLVSPLLKWRYVDRNQFRIVRIKFYVLKGRYGGGRMSRPRSLGHAVACCSPDTAAVVADGEE